MPSLQPASLQKLRYSILLRQTVSKEVLKLIRDWPCRTKLPEILARFRWSQHGTNPVTQSGKIVPVVSCYSSAGCCLQAEHERAGAQAAAAGKAAEAAEKRCEELQWRLQQQDAALAQRARLAEEARAATEGLSKVHPPE